MCWRCLFPAHDIYVDESIDSGSSGMATSKRLWICLSTSSSASDDTNTMARPLVPTGGVGQAQRSY